MIHLLRFNDTNDHDILIYTDTIFKYQFVDDDNTKIFCNIHSDNEDITIYDLPINAVQLVKKIHGDNSDEYIIRVGQKPPIHGLDGVADLVV